MGTFGTPISGLGSPQGTGLALQPVSVGDNDLTKFIRSIEGLSAAQGQGILGAGANQTQQGVGAAAPALQFLTKLVNGDQGEVTQAAQPEIDNITQQFDQIRNMISLQPRGGGKTSALAEAPFQKSGAIQRTEGQMRSNAAGALGGLATTLAGLGISEAGLGAGLEQQASNIAMNKAQMNIQETGNLMGMFGSLGQGIGSIVGGLIAKSGS